MDRQTPAEEMFDKLEKVVEIEQTFEAQQEPLVKLEKEEKEVYGQIIELTMQDYDEIVRLSDEAITIVEKRKGHIDKERQSIQESKSEFNSISEIIEKIEESELKTQASSLYDLMHERYEVHEDLYQYYTEGLGYDTDLYNLLKNEELTVDQLEEQINKVNKAYEKVLLENDKFNEKTDQYNKLKLEFYNNAELNVQSNEQEQQ